jgi:hypothetical protein
VSTASVSPRCVHKCCVATLSPQLLCRHSASTAAVSPHCVDSCCQRTMSTAAVSPRCIHSFCVATECPQLLCRHAVSPHCVHNCCIATLCCKYHTNALCQTVADQSQFTTVLTDGWTLLKASNISRQSLQFPSSKSLRRLEQRKVTLAAGRPRSSQFLSELHKSALRSLDSAVSNYCVSVSKGITAMRNLSSGM